MPDDVMPPIRAAVELLDKRIAHMKEVTERLFIRLLPVTTAAEDNYPVEPGVAREGNSILNCDLNSLADRVGAIATAVQLQIDRLEV